MLHNEVMMGIQEFIFGGKAEFTIYQNNNNKEVSAKYKVLSSEDGGSYFVYAGETGKLEYQGYLKNTSNPVFNAGRKGKNDTRLVKALLWVLSHSDNMDERVHVLHHGRCSVCGRKLTDAKSLVYGIGPKCLSKITI